MNQHAVEVLSPANLRYSIEHKNEVLFMSPADLEKLEKRVRSLAQSGGSLASMSLLHFRGAWLSEKVRELYASSTPSALAAMSEQDASDRRETLRQMQKDLAVVSKAIPFDRKLPAHLRPLTTTFQKIFLLSNATAAGIAALTKKLEGEIAVDLSGISLSDEELAAVRDCMQRLAPGWEEEEMGLYDQL